MSAKEFNIVVTCNTADRLKEALIEAAEVVANLRSTFNYMEVDEGEDIENDGAFKVEIRRVK
jgi:hypothetical protein